MAATIGALVTAGAAAAATYPAPGGNDFAGESQGWTSTQATCEATIGTSACTQQNVHTDAAGDPPGSLAATTEVTVNALGLFAGRSTWRSPGFSPEGAAQAGTLAFDRRVELDDLAALAPSVIIETYLVDESTSTEILLDAETLTASSGWTRRTLAVPAGTLSDGRPARIELRATVSTTTASIGALGAIAIGYDNVALGLPDRAGGDVFLISGAGLAGPGAAGSAGVAFTSRPLTDGQFNALAASTPWTAEAGRGPGGGVVARGDCTIIGTARADRIRGGPGNDVICGLGGNDVIDGAGGRDLIDGGSGADRLSGSGDRDMLIGLHGGDRLKGGAGKDRLGGGARNDRLDGGSGNDRLHGGSGRDRVAGGSGNDILRGGRQRDRLDGGRGRDRAPTERRARTGRKGDRMKGVERVRR